MGKASDTTWIEISQMEAFTELTRFSDPGKWELTTENLDPERVEIESLGEQGIVLSFIYPPQSGQAHIFLNRKIAINGVPKFMHIETSDDGEDYVVFVDIETTEEERYQLAPQRHANYTEPESMEFIFEQQWATRLASGIYI